MYNPKTGKFDIQCPYCFGKFDDTQALFRSEYVFADEIDDVDSSDKKEALLFSKVDFSGNLHTRKDKRSRGYFDFWTDNGGYNFYSSEVAADAREIDPYLRPIIDPAKEVWQRQLVRVNQNAEQDSKEAYLIKDKEGMVQGVKLRKSNLHEDVLCLRRVCPNCNNPWPDTFGKTKVITIPIIGITGAGKTVYMSSLLKNINRYMISVGYNNACPIGGYDAYLRNNKLEKGGELPKTTPSEVPQQPLFFMMRKNIGHNKLKGYTVVLYDLAGEYFNKATSQHNFGQQVSAQKKDITTETKHRKPLLINADGIVLVIDPSQLTGRDNNPAVAALDCIDLILNEESTDGQKCKKPIAICVSKADNENFLNYFGKAIQQIALKDAEYQKKIPADSFNELTDAIYRALDEDPSCFIVNSAENFEMSKFFAFSAISEALIQDQHLIAEPNPKRIEDSLLWLLAKNGYCDVEGTLSHDVKCPRCGSYWTRFKEYTIPGKKRIIGKDIPAVPFNYYCENCSTPEELYMFYVDEAGKTRDEGQFIVGVKRE